MYITKVILEGFKSYGERTVIGPFHQGHNVVVGRNGSGKSNFFSAIEFVLLADSSTLKAEQQRALLHEGSGPRPITASVEILFDNKDRRFPLDCDEVSLRRVVGLKKDQLFLNGRAANSKAEVRSNLEAAGFSCTNPYYVVRQGQINKVKQHSCIGLRFLQVACCSSEARLSLVKDVAGLGVYEEKRLRSEEELHKTELEIRETDASLVNVQQRLEQLGEEKEALEELKKMEREKKAIEAVMLEAELKESKEKLRNSAELQVSTESIQNKKDHADIVQSHAQKKETWQSLKSIIDDLEHQHTCQSEQVEALESRREALKLKKADLEEEINNAQVSSGGGGKLERLEQKLREVEKSLTELADEVGKRETRLSETTKEMESIYARLGRSRQFPTEDARDNWIRIEVEKIEESIREKMNFEEELQTLLNERRQKLREIETFEENREAKEQRLKDHTHEQLTLLTKERGDHRRQLHRLHGEALQLRHQLQTDEESSKNLMNRLRMLPSMKQAFQGLDAVNKVLEEVPDLKIGYHGTVANNFDCPEGLFTAVEQIAGGKLFHHVVDSDLVATAILKEVNKRKLPGVFDFLPICRLRPKQRKPFDKDQTNQAFPIIDKIECNVKLNAVMEFVFDGALVCRDMATVVALAKSTGRNCVTLEGDKSSSKGVMAGGYLDKNKSRISGWKKYSAACDNVQKTKDELNQLEAQRNKVSELEARAAQRMEKIHKEEREVEDEVQEMEQRVRQEGNSRQLRALVREGEEHLGRVVNEVKSLKQSAEMLQSELGMDMNSQPSLEERERCERLTRNIEQARKDFKNAHKKKLDLEADYMKLSEKIRSVEKDRNAEKVKRKLREEAERSLRLLDIELEEVMETLAKEKEAQLKMQKKEVKMTRELSKLEKSLEALETEEKRLASVVAKADAEVQKLIESSARLQVQYSNLMNKRDALGGVAPELIQKYKPRSRRELGKLLEEHLTKIRECRGVNQKADDQLNIFTKEEGKLSGRRDELVATKDEVENTLAVLDNKKTEQILYTYRQLYRNFATVFKELVPAGQGELLLTGIFDSESDGEQLEAATGLSTSVTFAGDAEPRRNMEQLSGGQKTLVALAFILAIQRCDPAPFYLFDEVDAALDADYRESVARVIHRQSGVAQFVTTTFRGELLKDADRHFGVYYRGKASKVMVVEREEAKEFVENESTS